MAAGAGRGGLPASARAECDARLAPARRWMCGVHVGLVPVLLLVAIAPGARTDPSAGGGSSVWHDGCLCELKRTSAAERSDFAMAAIFGTRYFRQSGVVAEFCPCSIETVQRLNTELIAPRLLPLLRRRFFRFFFVDLERKCPFWDDSNGTCAQRNCAIAECDADEVAALAKCDEAAAAARALGEAHAVLGDATATLDQYAWTDPPPTEAAQTDAGQAEAVPAEEAAPHFSRGAWFDLTENPEQYTGYGVEAGAQRIWQELHGHNSFHSPDCCGIEETETGLRRMPVEHRLFYRLASGLHTSVSSHLAANYQIDRRNEVWGLELDEYDRRVGAHPERLFNLHFAFLLVLRAVEVASTHFSEDFIFASGDPKEEAVTGRAVRELLSSQPEWPLTFDEQAAFAGVRADGCCASLPPGSCCEEEVERRTQLLTQFRSRLHNVSKLMDCVGCERCRLWGKLQVHGIGTALRLLYAPNRQLVLSSLRRADVVALFNLLGRLSHSVEVARLVVPLLKHAHCAGCKASEYTAEPDEMSHRAAPSVLSAHMEAWDPFSQAPW